MSLNKEFIGLKFRGSCYWLAKPSARERSVKWNSLPGFRYRIGAQVLTRLGYRKVTRKRLKKH